MQGAELTSGACRRRVVSQCRSDTSLTIGEPTWKTLDRETVEMSVGQEVLYVLAALDELYAVSVRVAHKEDPAAAAHGVGLTLEVHTPCLLELAGQRV